MTNHFDVDPHEPAVTNPRLLELVEAARAEPSRDTNVTLPMIRRQIAAKGRGFRNGVAAGVLLAAAAAVAFFTFASGPGFAPSAPVSDGLAGRGAEDVEAGAAPVPVVPFAADDARLSDAVRVTWKGGAPPRAHAAWELELGDGSYEIALSEPRPERLTIHVTGRKLELAHGELLLATHGSDPVVTLLSGVASWVDPGGTRTPLEIQTTVARRPIASNPDRDGSATQLAREAEELLANGERRAAIAALRNLVRRHPGSSAAQSALLDLGRESGNEGMREHARCAYQMYLDRFPEGQMRRDVQRSLDRLGRGAACDGLDPG